MTDEDIEIIRAEEEVYERTARPHLNGRALARVRRVVVSVEREALELTTPMGEVVLIEDSMDRGWFVVHGDPASTFWGYTRLPSTTRVLRERDDPCPPKKDPYPYLRR